MFISSSDTGLGPVLVEKKHLLDRGEVRPHIS